MCKEVEVKAYKKNTSRSLKYSPINIIFTVKHDYLVTLITVISRGGFVESPITVIYVTHLSYFVPIIFHNGSGYDFKFLVLERYMKKHLLIMKRFFSKMAEKTMMLMLMIMMRRIRLAVGGWNKTKEEESQEEEMDRWGQCVGKELWKFHLFLWVTKHL